MVVGYGGDVEGGMMTSFELHPETKDKLLKYFQDLEESFPSVKSDIRTQLEIFFKGGGKPDPDIVESLEKIVVGLNRERAGQILEWLDTGYEKMKIELKQKKTV